MISQLYTIRIIWYHGYMILELYDVTVIRYLLQIICKQIYLTLTSTTTPCEIETESTVNEGVLHTLRYSCTAASPLDVV